MSTFLLLSGGYFRRLCTGPKYYAQTPARIAVRAITLVCDCACSPPLADSLKTIAERGPRTRLRRRCQETGSSGHPDHRVFRRGRRSLGLSEGISSSQPPRALASLRPTQDQSNPECRSPEPRARSQSFAPFSVVGSPYRGPGPLQARPSLIAGLRFQVSPLPERLNLVNSWRHQSFACAVMHSSGINNSPRAVCG
jgi:hypothetical protein